MAAIAYPYVGYSARPRTGRSHLRLVADHDARVPLAPPARRRSPLRRLLPGIATVAVLVGTWFGAGALAGAGSPGLSQLPGTTRVPGGYAYVVRPGDTLWSIATRLDPAGDPGPLVARLTAELHTTTLTPGSVIVVP